MHTKIKSANFECAKINTPSRPLTSYACGQSAVRGANNVCTATLRVNRKRKVGETDDLTITSLPVKKRGRPLILGVVITSIQWRQGKKTGNF